MPDKRFLELLDTVPVRARVLVEEMRATHFAKSAGYAGVTNEDAWANFRLAKNVGVSPFAGCMVRLSDKYVRACNVIRNSDNEQVGESLRDTLLDLSSYALIAICLLEEEYEGRSSCDEASDGLIQASTL